MYKTMEQIMEEYDGYWVFMINCDEGDNFSISGGEVVLYNKSRDYVLRNMDYNWEGRDMDKTTYIRFIGNAPEGTNLLYCYEKWKLMAHVEVKTYEMHCQTSLGQ